MTAEWFDAAMAASPVMGVFRGASPHDAVELATRAWDAGAELVEVPIETADAVPSLAAVVAAGRERGKPVGAGTILHLEQLFEALGIGARFLVSPVYDTTIAEAAATAIVPHLPGVATATELQRARSAGFSTVKAFPASVLTPGWFAAMRGPYPDTALVATGGVGEHNAPAFLDAGAKVVGIGSAFGDPRATELLSQLISERRMGLRR